MLNYFDNVLERHEAKNESVFRAGGEIVKAVILVGGEGTRLRPFTYSRPKVMIPVGRKPILEYVVRALVENGINDIVMVVGYKKERIMSHFEDGNRFGAHIEYAFQQRQLGTAHALMAAADSIDDEFLLVAGDNIIDGRTVKDLVQGEAPAMLVTRSEIPSKYGVIQVSKGRVVSIVEKPEDKIGNIINTGMYRFTPDILKFMSVEPEGGGLGITHVLQRILPELNLMAITSTGRWIDAVYPWDLMGSMYQLLGIPLDAKLPHPQGVDVRVSPLANNEIPEKETGGLLKEIM